jgi:glucose-6-phosphate isomerase
MQLPDEAVSFNPQGLLQSSGEEWGPAAELRSRHLVSPGRFKDLHQRLLQCRAQVAADREIRNPPPEALPLEPGFINLPQDLLDNYRRKQEASEVGKVLALANRLREDAGRVVFLGAGGSHLGPAALFQALRSPCHNELPDETRLGTPRIYFEGSSAENDGLQELLDLLQITCVDPEQREERWAVVTISKSGSTLEANFAHRVFRREASEYYGSRSPWAARLFAAVTSPGSRVSELARALGVPEASILAIPEGVGGRFSVLSPAGLLPAAVMGLDVRALLLGAQAMTRRFLEEPVERNPVLQLAGLSYLLTEEQGKPIRAFAAWSRKLQGVGHWYEHLVSETLGKMGRGPTPLTVVQTAAQHSRGQAMQDGPRTWMTLNALVGQPSMVPIALQMSDRNEDDLNQHIRKSMTDVMKAYHAAGRQAAWESARPMGDILLPSLSEHTLGQLLQMLMLATVVEARLMGLNPYSSPGVDVAHRLAYQTLRKPPEPAAERPARPGGDAGR